MIAAHQAVFTAFGQKDEDEPSLLFGAGAGTTLRRVPNKADPAAPVELDGFTAVLADAVVAQQDQSDFTFDSALQNTGDPEDDFNDFLKSIGMDVGCEYRRRSRLLMLS